MRFSSGDSLRTRSIRPRSDDGTIFCSSRVSHLWACQRGSGNHIPVCKLNVGHRIRDRDPPGMTPAGQGWKVADSLRVLTQAEHDVAVFVDLDHAGVVPAAVGAQRQHRVAHLEARAGHVQLSSKQGCGGLMGHAHTSDQDYHQLATKRRH